MTDIRADAAIKAAVDATIARARQDWSTLNFENEYPTSGFGIGTLLPKDIHVTNQATGAQGSNVSSVYWGLISITTTSAKQTWIDLRIDDRLYIIVTGFFNLDPDPQITSLKFSAQGKELTWLNIEHMYGWDLARAYLSKPLVISPGRPFKVEIVGRNAKPIPERIGLLGYRVAKAEYIIIDTG